ncbi:alpha/beta hydrolase [Hamadaea tsunoensis]|uniref:alpha/beta hydrolase n=1 Tax=Hamadaea tsunoensis TaxID=53368 RepID=UPI00042A8C07|nr:alpha/beta hydrolase [Hamadaea tsunoensis]
MRLITSDGVAIDAHHDPGPAPLSPPSAGRLTSGESVEPARTESVEPARTAFVVAHGFTGTWRKPATRRAAAVFARYGGVVTFDFRGHGRSAGGSTVGALEIHDLEAAVGWARELGYDKIVTVGFSMGASVVVRHAALVRGVAAAVAVSGPARWYYRGTPPMRRVHLVIENPVGRMVSRVFLRTRIAGGGAWDPVPEAPFEVSGRIAPAPLLVVHGDADAYFPVEHAHQLYDAAEPPKELWIEAGFGHAENAAPPELLDRVAQWAVKQLTA